MSRTERKENIRALPVHTGLCEAETARIPQQRARRFASHWREPWPASRESSEGSRAQKARAPLSRFFRFLHNVQNVGMHNRRAASQSGRLDHVRHCAARSIRSQRFVKPQTAVAQVINAQHGTDGEKK